MNKTSTKFTLTSEGKLPRGSSLDCEPNGIYVFLVKNELVRFGESGSGFERIRKGFNNQLYKKNGKKNYIAYLFRHGLKNKELEVRYYSVNGKLLSEPEKRRVVEAELAYQFRKEKGNWPRLMIEIHFSNKMSKAQTKFVSDVIADIGI